MNIFFEEYGDELIIHDSLDFNIKLTKIGFQVPEMSDNNYNRRREIYYLFHFLMIKHSLGNVIWPLSVKKHEEPDFVISGLGEITIGLELTQATDTELERKHSISERSNFEKVVVMASDGYHLIPKNGPLVGMPFHGGASVQQWRRSVLNKIIVKTNKLNSKTYNKLPSNQLVIYANLHYPESITIFTNQLNILTKELEYTKCYSEYSHHFDHISIFDEEHFCEDALGCCSIYDTIKPPSTKNCISSGP